MKIKKESVVGTIVLILLVGIPLGFVFTPIFTLVFSAVLLAGLIKR